MICKRDEVDYLDYSGAVEAIFNWVPSVAKLSRAARLVILNQNNKACNAFSIKVNQILRLTVDTFLLITNIGGFAVYILFIGENMEKVMSSEFFSIGATSFSQFFLSSANITQTEFFAKLSQFHILYCILGKKAF